MLGGPGRLGWGWWLHELPARGNALRSIGSRAVCGNEPDARKDPDLDATSRASLNLARASSENRVLLRPASVRRGHRQESSLVKETISGYSRSSDEDGCSSKVPENAYQADGFVQSSLRQALSRRIRVRGTRADSGSRRSRRDRLWLKSVKVEAIIQTSALVITRPGQLYDNGFMRSLAQAQLKRTRAVELLAAGCNYDEIARQVGFTSRGSAYRAVTKALAEREIEGVDELRVLELDRLDALHAAFWHQALAGDIAACKIILAISAQRRRLYGIGERRSGRPHSTTSVLVQPWLEGNPREATGPVATCDDPPSNLSA